MSLLDLELLRSLAAIVAHDSFAAAALRLGKTQAAMTQQMQRLEAQIGHPLFEKQGRHKRLTAQGQQLLTYAHHMLAINDEAMRSFQPGQLQGTLRIGAPHDVSETMLPPLLAEIMRTSPLLQLDIHVGRSPFVVESLKRGEIDMAIANRAEPELEGAVLRTSPTVWLCSMNYLHDRTRPVPLIDADGPSIFRRIGHEALDAAGVPWTQRYTSSSLVGIRAALRAGLGVTARGVEQVDNGLRVLGPADGMPPLPDLVYRLYIRRHVLNPLIREVFDSLRSRMGLSEAAEA
ncbi:MAG: LysR substrate-binding domain-containing protein [Pseudomonadota bacterium]